MGVCHMKSFMSNNTTLRGLEPEWSNPQNFKIECHNIYIERFYGIGFGSKVTVQITNQNQVPQYNVFTLKL